MSKVDIGKLRDIAEKEFNDIVAETLICDVNELQIMLADDSFI